VCADLEFAGGEHMEVGINGVMVECDEGGNHEGGPGCGRMGKVANVEGNECDGFGGGRTDGFMKLEAGGHCTS
jgi:hypothetical protein